MSNIKVYDISQSNFKSISDINNVEKEFKEVEKASKGKSVTILDLIVKKKIKLENKRRTKKGMLEYSKWLAHKRFLNDFSNFNQKELPEIILWIDI